MKRDKNSEVTFSICVTFIILINPYLLANLSDFLNILFFINLFPSYTTADLCLFDTHISTILVFSFFYLPVSNPGIIPKKYFIAVKLLFYRTRI